MPTDDREPAARLRRYWDDVVRAGPSAPAAADLDRALAETVRRLHALDQPPPPEVGLAERIWEDLMSDSIAGHAAPFGAPSSIPSRPNGSVPADPPSRTLPRPAGTRRWRSVVDLAAVAVLLLAIGGGLIATDRLARERNEPAPAVAGSPVATPPAAGEVPGPEECRVAPRMAASVLAAGDPPPSPSTVDPAATPLPAGVPADESTVAAIRAAMREWAACANAGDPLRWTALFSDGYLRRLMADGAVFTLSDEPPAELPEFLARPPSPRPAAQWRAGPTVREVRALPDDRVAATIEEDPASGSVEGGRVVLVFVRAGDRYLIDDARPVIEPETPTFPRPSATGTIDQPNAALRDAPGNDARVVDVLPRGRAVAVTGPPEAGDGSAWLPIADLTTGLSGYVVAAAVRADPSATPVEIAVDQTAVVVRIAVDVAGVLGDDAAAIAEVEAALHRALDRYDGRCRVAVAVVLGHEAGPRVGLEGTELARTVSALLAATFGDLFADTSFEALVDDETPRGRVDLRLYFYGGCAPASEATPGG